MPGIRRIRAARTSCRSRYTQSSISLGISCTSFKSRRTLSLRKHIFMTAIVPKIPAFRASRLTPTTFLIVEHSDAYDEQPHIYVKFVDDTTLLILDTGCGGKTDKPDINLTSLREFVETVDVVENEGKPLNEGGRRAYIVILSHCHYDHICGYLCFRIRSLYKTDPS